jgi:hypothetical protein
MKFTALAILASSASAFAPSASFTRRSSSLFVLEMPKETKKISKLEQLKVDSDHLIHPLVEVRSFLLLLFRHATEEQDSSSGD